MRSNYVCKRVRNQAGQVTGYEVKFRCNTHALPRGDYEIVYGESDIQVPRVVIVDGIASVVEDETAKLEKEEKSNQKKNRKKKFKDAVDTIEDEIQGANNLGQLKTVLSGYIKDLFKMVSDD